MTSFNYTSRLVSRWVFVWIATLGVGFSGHVARAQTSSDEVGESPAADAGGNAVLLVRALGMREHRATLKGAFETTDVKFLDDSTTRDELAAAALMGLRCVDNTDSTCFAKLATMLPRAGVSEAKSSSWSQAWLAMAIRMISGAPASLT